MSKTTLISEMQKFHFGSKVFCSDGEYGILADVIFDPQTRIMTHVGIKKGRLFGPVHHLPFSTISDASSDGVNLNVKMIDVLAQHVAQPGGVRLDGRSAVELTKAEGRGSLQLVAVHPENGELSYIVAHHVRPGQDTLLRAEFIAALENGRVTVMIPAEMLATLPPYQPDDVLQRAVEDAIFDITPLHIDMPAITIRVLDGVLYLDGNISSALRADIVQDQAAGVPGLLEIKNNLIGDDTLANEVAMALGRDPATRDLPIGVYPRLGVVRLSGSVRSEAQKKAAGEIARSFAGVRGVINELTVNPNVELLGVMASTGAEVEDQVPGKYVRHTK